MTRAERQDQTRERLLDAAERIFTRQGFHDTSVDQIADEAGFSKGAVYSQFDGKDELFIAVVERRVDSRALAIEAGIDPTQPIVEQAAAAGAAFLEVFEADPYWSLLLMEYAAHVARHPELRQRFAARSRRVRAEMSRLIDTHLGALGVSSPIPSSHLATILFSLGSGIILERLTDPDGVADSTFGDALALLFTGLSAGSGGPSKPVRKKSATTAPRA